MVGLRYHANEKMNKNAAFETRIKSFNQKRQINV